jgi:hypothetical protein
MHAVVVAVVAATAQLLEQALCRAPLPARQLGFLLQDRRQNLNPLTELRRRLDLAFGFELRLVAADDLANRPARYRQRAHDLSNRAGFLKIRAPDRPDHIHADHPLQSFPASRASRKDADTKWSEGSVLDAKITLQEVTIASDFISGSSDCTWRRKLEY